VPPGGPAGLQSTVDTHVETGGGEQWQAELNHEDDDAVCSTCYCGRPVFDAERLVDAHEIVVVVVVVIVVVVVVVAVVVVM